MVDIALIGAGRIGAQVERRLEECPELGLEPVGFVDSHPPDESQIPGRHLPVLGGPDDLEQIVARTGAQHVVIAFLSSRGSDADGASVTRVADLRGEGAGAAVCELLCAIHCSCILTSCAVCNRSSGSFARHALVTCSSAGGDMGCTAEMGCGSDARMAATMLAWLLPVKAHLPDAISYRTAPSAKISDRASASFPSTCSGDMYWKVPSIMPWAVNG